ncbi:MAG: dNTP triphosphohydrolase [Saprospiraceae bacterium]|nr:dNTP triphosphohydrolase [Saprospiraceae bacterium]
MENWASCISHRRYGYDNSSDANVRSEFIRDYDRLIFSSAFRRLQNKTQVFPLPGNVFVHNRLTHSLEVASVGRSLGSIIGSELSELHSGNSDSSVTNFYKYDLSGVIASACLAHDVGNPAFGHSGEKAISHYFEKNQNKVIGELELVSYFSNKEWKDLTNYEGNANALRLLTHQFKGKLSGGQRLTFVTLASLLKYPCDSSSIDKTVVSQKKYGFFQTEADVFDHIAEEFQLKKEPGIYKRHPFVFLVEAADDICYRIIDMEDAHRIHILSTGEIEHAFYSVISSLEENRNSLNKVTAIMRSIDDANEKVAYLRAKCINSLVQRSSRIFLENKNFILQGSFNSTLVDQVEKDCAALHDIEDISIKKIYNHHSVIEVEIAGYNVLSEILDLFISAVLSENRTALQKKCLMLVPLQYAYHNDDTTAYIKVMSVLDFVSGMTDGYATELYRKIKGIEIPSHK